MIKLNRIGYKLLLAGLLGVVLCAGMIVNQTMSEAASNRAATQQAIASSAIEARASLRGMQLGVRDVRLAKSGQDIEKASAAVAEGFAASTKGMDSAISKVTKAKSLVNAYEAVSGEIRRSQLRIFEITAKRNQIST